MQSSTSNAGLTLEKRGDALVVKCQGVNPLLDLTEQLEEICRTDDVNVIIIDMQRVKTIRGAGLETLMKLRDSAASESKWPVLIGVSFEIEQLASVLDLSDQIPPHFSNLEDVANALNLDLTSREVIAGLSFDGTNSDDDLTRTQKVEMSRYPRGAATVNMGRSRPENVRSDFLAVDFSDYGKPVTEPSEAFEIDFGKERTPRPGLEMTSTRQVEALLAVDFDDFKPGGLETASTSDGVEALDDLEVEPKPDLRTALPFADALESSYSPLGSLDPAPKLEGPTIFNPIMAYSGFSKRETQPIETPAFDEAQLLETVRNSASVDADTQLELQAQNLPEKDTTPPPSGKIHLDAKASGLGEELEATQKISALTLQTLAQDMAAPVLEAAAPIPNPVEEIPATPIAALNLNSIPTPPSPVVKSPADDQRTSERQRPAPTVQAASALQESEASHVETMASTWLAAAKAKQEPSGTPLELANPPAASDGSEAMRIQADQTNLPLAGGFGSSALHAGEGDETMMINLGPEALAHLTGLDRPSQLDSSAAPAKEGHEEIKLRLEHGHLETEHQKFEGKSRQTRQTQERERKQLYEKLLKTQEEQRKLLAAELKFAREEEQRRLRKELEAVHAKAAADSEKKLRKTSSLKPFEKSRKNRDKSRIKVPKAGASSAWMAAEPANSKLKWPNDLKRQAEFEEFLNKYEISEGVQLKLLGAMTRRSRNAMSCGDIARSIGLPIAQTQDLLEEFIAKRLVKRVLTNSVATKIAYRIATSPSSRNRLISLLRLTNHGSIWPMPGSI